ncbi:alpha/beta hydrolase [Pedobacter frigiditerrae]|uniref:Alpha/beta hydrolase n=1 Tax=Pedobacter frigiditerrae TaxID=2530452 RepID=A0A4R0MK42_9SPHI|nr:alpha/beta hydrolase-fold protein [Pedobacter frigiditerrae]TCC86970.1 alpha/beta hydrolase [Pedobacter frigiditerrae]
MYIFRWLTILFLFVALHAQSQHTESYKYPPSEVVTIHSKVLNEDRKVYVHCPKVDSTDLNKRFPVLYLMDADNHFELLAQYVDYLSRPDVLAMPKMIVVGIANTNRTRDLTPTSSITNYMGKPDSSSYKLSGGNESFLQFIEKELIPMIDKNYKTEPYKIFAGHSFGGISALNCMLTYPDMFNAYIAVSPSLWWDNEYLLKLTDEKLKEGSVLNKKLFYSNGNEGGNNSFFHKGLLKLDSTIANKKLKRLDYVYKHYSTETHMTEPVVAYFDALRFIFKDWGK